MGSLFISWHNLKHGVLLPVYAPGIKTYKTATLHTRDIHIAPGSREREDHILTLSIRLELHCFPFKIGDEAGSESARTGTLCLSHEVAECSDRELLKGIFPINRDIEGQTLFSMRHNFYWETFCAMALWDLHRDQVCLWRCIVAGGSQRPFNHLNIPLHLGICQGIIDRDISRIWDETLFIAILLGINHQFVIARRDIR